MFTLERYRDYGPCSQIVLAICFSILRTTIVVNTGNLNFSFHACIAESDCVAGDFEFAPKQISLESIWQSLDVYLLPKLPLMMLGLSAPVLDQLTQASLKKHHFPAFLPRSSLVDPG